MHKNKESKPKTAREEAARKNKPLKDKDTTSKSARERIAPSPKKMKSLKPRVQQRPKWFRDRNQSSMNMGS